MTIRLSSRRSAVAVLALAGLAACDKNNSTPARGVSWTAEGKSVTADNYDSYQYNGDIIITGYSSSDNQESSITLLLPAQTGTVDFATANASTAVYKLSTPSSFGKQYRAQAGTAKITSVTDSTCMGTFSFDATDGTISKSITKGRFNVRY